jgi:hypothetical protein
LLHMTSAIMYYYRFLLFAIYMNQVPEKLHVLDSWPHNNQVFPWPCRVDGGGILMGV